MKKVFVLTAFFALALASLVTAQDSTQVKKKPAASKDRILIGGGFANWMNLPSGVTVKFAGSRSLDVAVMYDQPLGTSPISLAIGLGFSAQNIATNAQLDTDSTGNTPFTPYADSVYTDIKRNKLSTSYLTVPFELRFRSKPDKAYRRWNIAAGFKAGLLLQSHSKFEDNTIKTKSYPVENLNLLTYGPTIRIGYGQVSVYGYYALSKLFEDGKGPGVSSFNFGLVLSPF